MTITPTGSPAWVRAADHTQYGGHTEKQDFMGVGAINALTDVSAAEFCRACSDLAAVTRTAPMWIITYLNNDTATDPPTIEVALGMTGVTLVSYEGDNPPTGFPSAARTGNGVVVFTFDSSYDDEYGVAGAYAVQHATASVQSSSHRTAPVSTTATTATVRVFDDAGAAVLDARVCLVVT